MMIFNVFGRTMGIKAINSGWALYRVDLNENKFSRLYDYSVPADLSSDELVQWLDDIFHEAATAKNPVVKRLA
ncbi:hypothetical protein ACMGGR_06980 [Erwinia sp. BNK-24-b]|uniref:DUF7661 family protein n=1 Tax=unclassified Erwinia TaxID=2622719 RepID=UPI0039BFB04F